MKNGPKSGKGSGKSKIKDKKTVSAEGLGIPGVDVARLERLLDFMSAHGLEEFEYEHAGLHIRLRKGAGEPAGVPRPAGSPKPRSAASAASADVSAEAHHLAPAPAAPVASAAAPVPAPEPEEELHVIKSPIVGTFYSAASPEIPPFVKVGEEIQAGQVVCIIEAMKLMNEIESDVKGAVAKVLVENGQPVEYGQPLFAIRPVIAGPSGTKGK